MKTFFIACFATAALAQEPAPEYTLKESLPRAGSMIRRSVIEFKQVAVNQPYSELSARDRANLHSWWESIAEGDEPPFPVTGLKPIHEAVYKAQQKLLVEGELFLIATVDPAGKVIDVKAAGSPSQAMTKFAASVLAVTKFKPAVCGGTPCQMEFPVRYYFTRKRN